MRNLHIPGTTTTPEVHLDLMDVCFSITGRSVPSNAHAFFAPVLCWLVDVYQRQLFGPWQVGLEILLLNGAFTFAGLWLVSRPAR